MIETTYNPYVEGVEWTEADYISGMRQIRHFLLVESDWTQTEDAPLSPEKKAEWKAYRQSLRDFPSTWTPAPTVEVPDPPSK